MVTLVKKAVEEKQRPGVFAPNVQVGAAEMFHGIGAALSRDGSKDLALVFLRLGIYLDPSADVISLALGQLLDTETQHDAANRIYDAIPATSPMKPTAVVRVAQNLDSMGDRTEPCAGCATSWRRAPTTSTPSRCWATCCAMTSNMSSGQGL